jgi:hypothetical protein
VRLEVFTAVLLKIQAFWDVMPFQLANSHQCFGGLQCLWNAGISLHGITPRWLDSLCAAAITTATMPMLSHCNLSVYSDDVIKFFYCAVVQQ